MSRRVYFAFHYEQDIFRVNVVRQSNVVLGVEQAGFFDNSEYEEAKRKDDATIRRLIRDRISGTSVTVVLIGAETHLRPWVDFEIEESINNHNGFVGVFIHTIPCARTLYTSIHGRLPLALGGELCPTMTWSTASQRFSVLRLRGLIEAAGRRADLKRMGSARMRVAARLARHRIMLPRKPY